MDEENPQKIKQADIVVGIPSYNEADSIAGVVEVVDRGLLDFFFGKKAVIINADNCSPDDTKKVFLSVNTRIPKIYVSTPEGVTGKGNNIYNIFLKAKELGASACMLIDADIKSVQPLWVQRLVEPIMLGYDYITPLYSRDKYDGSITNNICYPLVYGLLGYDLRQPIGGEVSFSKKMIDYLLEQKWANETRLFGIDIFMSISAILSGYRIGAVSLGPRIHKPSLPKLDFMFYEVTSTFFSLLAEHRGVWQKKMKVVKPSLLHSIEDRIDYPNLEIDMMLLREKSLADFERYYSFFKNDLSEDLQKILEKNFIEGKEVAITSLIWVDIVYQLFKTYMGSQEKEKVINFLRALYFGRLSYFIQETIGKSQEEAEQMIVKQAELFYKHRDLLADV